ncbi:phage major capsid protein [Prescottella agglutinans]|uniref:HK97 family phage major capsid protein n=1 Tax=Prescottella agglutinans TaxID=1644129 RepID=A0ABT6M9J6_9NOCA|nr:phage major capsid protein [Prescottella agglutinans]MDH6280984.1 HK97 family phage major capsid protein [Prescottella agglutinans]
MALTITQKRDAAVKKAQALVAGTKGRDLSDSDSAEFEALVAEVKGYDAHLAMARKDQALVDQIKALGAADYAPAPGGVGQPIYAGPAEGSTGHLTLTGTKGRALAQDMSRTMRGDGTAGMKALTQTGDVVTNVPLLNASQIEDGRPALSLLEALTTVVRPPVYKIQRQTLRDNNAAGVAPGALKPTSRYGLETVDMTLKVIAHVSEPVDTYTLADGVNLTRFLESEMTYGLRAEVERQLINGTGTVVDGNDEFTGILNTSGIQAQAFDTDVLTSTRAAMTKLEVAGYVPSLFVLSPDDWQKLELTRNMSGQLDLGHAAVDRAARRLWGTPIVVSNAVPAKTALLLDTTHTLVDSDGLIDTKWSEAVGEDFARNQVRVRVEGRFNGSIHHPLSIVKVATAA